VNCARVLNLLGFALNASGAAVVSYSLVGTWRTYGRGPLSPALARAIASLRSILERRREVHRTATVSVDVAAVSDRAHGVVRQGFPDELSVEEKVARLVRACKGLGDEIEANRREAESSDQVISERLATLDDKWTRDHAMLESMARDIAIGDVRPQLVGLLLVVVGTTLSLWATFLYS
jgi:hypothetical protein